MTSKFGRVNIKHPLFMNFEQHWPSFWASYSAHHTYLPWVKIKQINPFVAVGWFINHYFFVKFFFLEEKIIPKIFQTFGWCIYPVSVTLWAPWLGDFDNLNLFYRKIKIEKMPKFETLLATRGLIDKNEEFLCLSERKFPELFKTHPTIVYSPLLVPSMACQI